MPCSVIIVGVGNADFSMMRELDGDNGRLTDPEGFFVRRDIVQFVNFNESVAKGNLAEEVLREVPSQFCAYMELAGIAPKCVTQTLPSTLQ
jgi:hypothetical protein